MNLHYSIYGMMRIYFFVPACTEKGVWGYAQIGRAHV